VVVRGGGAGDWAAAIDALVSDPARLEAMRRAAHAWSLAHVPSWEQVLAEDLIPIWRRAGAGAGTNPAIAVGEQLRAGAGARR
jgi:hypothetical protein